MNENYLKGFNKGLGHIPKRLQKEIREKLSDAIGIKNPVSWYDYKNGRVKPSIKLIIAINKVFLEYGVKESNVWGKE